MSMEIIPPGELVDKLIEYVLKACHYFWGVKYSRHGGTESRFSQVSLVNGTFH
jgi:hypothetical protein